MAKKITATTSAARQVLTEEERAASELKWRADRIRRFEAEAKTAFEGAQASMMSDIEKGYELSWSITPRYVVAREVYHLAVMYLKVEGKSDVEVIECGREVRELLNMRMISNHSGMHSGGELNSTNPFSRAIQAAKWSALYEVYSHLNYSLGK